jgi:hypothetical protein
MNDSGPLSLPSAGYSRSPWNKGKIVGPRPPLRRGHVWPIRAGLHLELRVRDLALFNLAIDSADPILLPTTRVPRCSVRERRSVKRPR